MDWREEGIPIDDLCCNLIDSSSLKKVDYLILPLLRIYNIYMIMI
jgi:hypothetical protein